MKRILIAILILPFLYWLPVNLFLLSHAITPLASSGEGKSFNVRYDLGWSFIPGKIQIRSLTLDGTDENVHWIVSLHGVALKPDFLMLTRKNLFIYEIHVDSVGVNIRNHLESEKAAVHARLSEGAQAGSDPRNLPWRITIQKIRIDDVSPAQMGSNKYVGKSFIDGSFMLLPGHELELGVGTHWQITEGQLFQKDDLLLDEMVGDSKVTIHPTNLTRVSGNQIFETMDIHQDLNARVYSSNFFGLLLKPYQSVVSGGTLGTVNNHLVIDQGVFMPGTAIDADFEKVHLVGEKDQFDGTGSLHWSVKHVDPRNVGELSIPLKNINWSRGKHSIAKAKDFNIDVKSHDLALYHMFEDMALNAGSDSIEAGPLSEILPIFSTHPLPKESFDTGKSHIKVHAQFVPKVKNANAQFSIDTDKVNLSYNKGITQFQSGLKAGLKISAPRYDLGHFYLSDFYVDLKKIKVTNKNKVEFESNDWNLSLKTDRALFEQATSRLKTSFSIYLTDLKMPVRYFMPDKFAVNLGTSLYPLKDFKGTGLLKWSPTLVDIENFKATTSSGPIDANFYQHENEETQIKVFANLGLMKICLTQFPGESSLDSHVGLSSGRCDTSDKTPEPAPYLSLPNEKKASPEKPAPVKTLN